MTFFITKILVPVLVLGFLIFVHELGHFLVAKWRKVGVLRFSLGFGPSLWSYQRGETRYQISAIPLGGYVQMIGERPDADQYVHLLYPKESDSDEVQTNDKDEQSEELTTEERLAQLPPEVKELINDRSRWFIEKSLWERTAIVFAGPLFNFLFAIIFIMASSLIYGEAVIDGTPTIGEVLPKSPAEISGLQVNDKIVNINGLMVSDWNEMAKNILYSDGEDLRLTIERDQTRFDMSVTPKVGEIPTRQGTTEKIYRIGIKPRVMRESVSIGQAFVLGVMRTTRITYLTIDGIIGMFRGSISPKEIHGPLFIFDTASEYARRGLEDLLIFMTVLSVSLAVLNLLPIPILDGGHLMFFAIEAIFGPVSLRKRELAQQCGMFLLLLLMVFAFHNDFTQWSERPSAIAGRE